MHGAEAFEKRLGMTLKGKYRLHELLGVGGMAAVYRGTHRNGNPVAVKILHEGISMQIEVRDRFLREGYVANRVEHRGAVRVLDDDIAEDGSVFLVMELLEGETLDARRLRAGHRLPDRDVAEWGYQLLDVLAAAHRKGIIHRDIKPENLFLTHEGALKALDFGIARLRDASMGGIATATQTGHVLGTPAFLPPEQALGRARDIDQQTDLWAVGATMFTLISGRYVHEAETVEEMIVYAGSRLARPLLSVAQEVPGALAAVVDRALAFDKAARWPHAIAMQEALEKAYRDAYRTSLRAVDVGVFELRRPAGRPDLLSDVASAPTVPGIAQTTPATARSPTAPVAQPTSTTGGVEGRGASRSRFGRGLGRRWLVIAGVSAVVGIGLLRTWAWRGGDRARAPATELGMRNTAVHPSEEPAATATIVALTPFNEIASPADGARATVNLSPRATAPQARPPSRAGARNQDDQRVDRDSGVSSREPPAESAASADEEPLVNQVLFDLRGATGAPAPTTSSIPAGGGEGFLNINSIPPSICFVDGKQLGATPKMRVTVAAGAHQVKFVSANQATKTVSVTVKAGETKAALADLIH